MSQRETRNILLTGAGSAIARALAERLAADGDNLVLAGRDVADLSRTAADLRLRFNVKVDVISFDDCVARLPEGLDGVVACHGLMFDQTAAEADPDLAREMIDVNYTSVVLILERAAADFLKRGGRGKTIAAISSVAGDRGRKSNYLYGAPKAAVSAYLDGLRHRLAPSGVAVLTIKPGFVDTKMTWGKPGMFLVASPAKVAGDIHRALRRGRGGVIYTPWFWRWIMFIIRSIPEPIFKRLNI
jgi:decaprenylphospho-beta-D-erythro-pentofuranosid-2-ulose 2-reductase